MNHANLPTEFLWGAATAGHQNDGGDENSDTTFLENLSPTVFSEPAGHACGAWKRWPEDLDLVVNMGLNAFRFSVEWARIEPEEGRFSESALARYDALIDGCLERGLTPVATYNHFTAPHWFAMKSGWMADSAAEQFAEYCALVTRRLGDRIGIAVTLNEPNLMSVLAQGILTPEIWEQQALVLDAASAATGVERYRTGNVARLDEIRELEDGFAAAHTAARAAIKSERATLPVGLSIAVTDEVALPGGEQHRDRVRQACYERWLDLASQDDFIGVQNYERKIYGPSGPIAPPADAQLNGMGTPLEPASLAGAVKYVHEVAKVPVVVTEHGVSSSDDEVRAGFIPPALTALDEVIAEGVPVLGYHHWTLLDNFEWLWGYGPKFGLHEVDRTTLDRTPKQSAQVYAQEVRKRRPQTVDNRST